MRALFSILLIFALTIFLSDAQVIRFAPNEIYKSYTAVAGDTAKSTTAKNFDIFVGKDFLYRYDVQVSADSSGDGTNFSIQMKSGNDNSNWYNIGSAVTWYVSETDTIIQFTNYPSSESWAYGDTSAGGEVADYTITKQYPVGWRYLRITFTGAGASARMELTGITAALRRD